jgi:hypothetical protein
VPTLLTATPSSGQVTLTWTDLSSDTSVTGYRVYYDQSGKSQLVADVGMATTFTNTGLTNGVKYCYKVTSYTATCESDYSNALCATPNAVGQLKAGIAEIRTGVWVTSGKGKNATRTFEYGTTFAPGDEIVFRVKIIDTSTGLALSGATADLTISGPEALSLTTGTSDSAGIAEVVWKTSAPNKKGSGGTTTGSYSAAASGVTATGYSWDGVATSATFSLQ